MAQPIWITPAGSLGNYPFGIYAEIQLSANPVTPATSITYTLLSGSLPNGLLINSSGKIYGTPVLVTAETTYNFAIRVTDNLGNIRDRTFSITVSGNAIPSFTTPSGSILSVNDSTWVQTSIVYDNPDITNPVSIRVQEGTLPPGLEISSDGLIRGYAQPPTITVNIPQVITSATSIDSSSVITCLSTTNFSVGRALTFSGGLLFGGVDSTTTYYVKSVINATSFTISTTQNEEHEFEEIEVEEEVEVPVKRLLRR
jgi:hypothetical protein